MSYTFGKAPLKDILLDVLEQTPLEGALRCHSSVTGLSQLVLSKEVSSPGKLQ